MASNSNASIAWNGLANGTQYEWYAVVSDANKSTTGSAASFTTRLPAISGDAGAAGATLNYTDGTAKSVTADGSGNYSLSVSSGWSGTVTPVKAGYLFAPASKNYSNVLADKTGQNYSADGIPTNITLTTNSVAENSPVATTVGNLTTSDPDVGDTFTYTLVNGGSYPDNAAFQIAGNVLKTNAIFDFETKPSYYTIRVQTNDGHGGVFAKNLIITIDNINDLPTLNAIANPPAVNEDAGLQMVNLSGITAGGESQPLLVTAASSNPALIPNPVVAYTSPNAAGSLSYTPVAGQSGTAVVTVTVTDAGLDGNLGTSADNGSFQRTFSVIVNPLNHAPVANAQMLSPLKIPPKPFH